MPNTFGGAARLLAKHTATGVAGGASLLRGAAGMAARVGYDRRLGPTGALTYRGEGREFPQTVALNLPGLPGLVLTPERGLNEEEVAHEGSHVKGGLPRAIAGKMLGKLFGTGFSGTYTDPDEVMAYQAQPDTPSTRSDLQTIRSLSGLVRSPRYRDYISNVGQGR